jgi:hypothetical protein
MDPDHIQSIGWSDIAIFFAHSNIQSHAPLVEFHVIPPVQFLLGPKSDKKSIITMR